VVDDPQDLDEAKGGSQPLPGRLLAGSTSARVIDPDRWTRERAGLAVTRSTPGTSRSREVTSRTHRRQVIPPTTSSMTFMYLLTETGVHVIGQHQIPFGVV
jgi:hypothetical protein